MASCDLVILVRDAKTGDIIVKPPEEELWLVREKVGLGRAAKNDWNVISEVGSEFFEQMDEHRKWHFGFKEVCITGDYSVISCSDMTIESSLMLQNICCETDQIVALRPDHLGSTSWLTLFQFVQQRSISKLFWLAPVRVYADMLLQILFKAHR